MTDFLEIVLIILLIYFALKFILRLAMPYLLKYLAKKATQRMEKAFFGNAANPGESTTKTGKTSIDKMPERKKRSNKTVGEYVDYEEID